MDEFFSPRICAYRFEADKEVRVEWRGDVSWAIVRCGENLNKSGEWEREPLPSNRDVTFFERCRYMRDDALKIVDAYLRSQYDAH